jgi:hypothetical protein
MRSGHVVQLWAPRPGERHVAGWYEPAARAGRAVEHLRFRGRVERGLLPALWLYVDERDGEELLLDITGVTHEVQDDHRRRAGYRFGRVAAPTADPAGTDSTDGTDGTDAVVLRFRPRSEGAE